MKRFLTRFENHIVGILSGVDRVLFRGTLRSISYVEGLELFLRSRKVLNRDFVRFAQEATEQVRVHIEEMARAANRPFLYLESSRDSKEELARIIQERDRIEEGLICVFSCVEPCHTFRVRGNRQNKTLDLVPQQGKCLHYYVYWMDREFGFLHVRLQSWLPFAIQVCINGREWLGRQMDQAGIEYERRDNCFTRIADVERAQTMMLELEQRNWEPWLSRWAKRINGWLGSPHGRVVHGYYWSARQTELATDVMFDSERALDEIYPSFIRLGIEQFRTEDVLRFWGQRRPYAYRGEVTTHLGRRWQGVRIKHRIGRNSIKMYNKQGSVLRIETTINDPRSLRVHRRATRQGQPTMAWLPLRKGIADFRRRMQISRAANERYLEALAVVAVAKPCHKVLDPVSQPIQTESRRFRPLHPLAPRDADRFQRLLDARFLLHGFRARDLKQEWAELDSEMDLSDQQISGRITRWLCLLRAHGVIYRLRGTQRYQLTKRGRLLLTTASKLRNLDTKALVA